MDPVAPVPPLGDVIFYRRLWPKWISIKPSRTPPIRPASVSFKDGRGEVSLFRADLTTEEAVLNGYDDHSLVTIDHGTIRELGLTVEHRPHAGGPAHYVLSPHPTGSQRTALAKAADWVRYRGPTGRNAWLHFPRFP
jgi:hypothetical protein